MRGLGYGLLGLGLFVALWKWAGIAGWTQPGTMPDPFLLPQALMDEWRSDRLMPALLSSLTHYVWGLLGGTVLGFLVGALAATQRQFDQTHLLLARILRPIPPLAWVVFAVAWFGVSMRVPRL